MYSYCQSACTVYTVSLPLNSVNCTASSLTEHTVPLQSVCLSVQLRSCLRSVQHSPVCLFAQLLSCRPVWSAYVMKICLYSYCPVCLYISLSVQILSCLSEQLLSFLSAKQRYYPVSTYQTASYLMHLQILYSNCKMPCRFFLCRCLMSISFDRTKKIKTCQHNTYITLPSAYLGLTA